MKEELREILDGEFPSAEPGARPAIELVQGVPLLFRVCRLCGSDHKGLLPIYMEPVEVMVAEDWLFTCCDPDAQRGAPSPARPA